MLKNVADFEKEFIRVSLPLCHSCYGSGVIETWDTEKSTLETCLVCGGRGEINVKQWSETTSGASEAVVGA